jgi:hypothetical protein
MRLSTTLHIEDRRLDVTKPVNERDSPPEHALGLVGQLVF